MQLDDQQRARLREVATREGIDPEELIAAAESEDDERPTSAGEEAASGAAPANVEPPKLFQYHLPFVRVREVRRVWLGLTEAFPGDDEIASEWAAKFSGGQATVTPADEPAP